MNVDFKALATTVRDINHTVQIGLLSSHRAGDAVLPKAIEAGSVLRSLVAGGADDARAASALVDSGTQKLNLLSMTRGLPDDQIVRALVKDAQTTWAAAVHATDNLYARHGGSVADVGTPRGLPTPRGI